MLFYWGLVVGITISTVESFLPLTVVSAISLFFVKEVSELIKKRSEKKRKITAYKILIAEELLKNAWTIKLYRDVFSKVGGLGFNNLRYEKKASGDERLTLSHNAGSVSVILSHVHTAIFDRSVVEIAALDRKFFELAKGAYQSLAEIKFLRSMIINFADDQENSGHIDGLQVWGNQKLDDAETTIGELYRLCTGYEMNSHKVRSFA